MKKTTEKKLDPKKLRTDPIYFIEEVIGHKLTWFQKEWLDLARKHHRVCFMAFRMMWCIRPNCGNGANGRVRSPPAMKTSGRWSQKRTRIGYM